MYWKFVWRLSFGHDIFSQFWRPIRGLRLFSVVWSGCCLFETIVCYIVWLFFPSDDILIVKLFVIFCSNYLTDLTTEESNFLVVMYSLKNIVYPVIKHEFDTQCPDHVWKEICMGICEQQNAKDCKRSSKENLNKSSIKRIYLTQDQRARLSKLIILCIQWWL